MKAGLRSILTIGIALAAANVAGAQQQVPAALAVPRPLGPPPGTLDLYRRDDNFHTISPQQPWPIYVSGPGVVYVPVAIGVSASPPVPGVAAPAHGGLRLEMQPGGASVVVDGFYVGIVDDYGLRGRVLDLKPGSHHIQVKQPGYAPAEFDVNIKPGEIVRYRGDLQLLAPPAPSGPTRDTNVQFVPKTYYVIPDCYAGDRPPARPLRRGCDVSKMRTVR